MILWLYNDLREGPTHLLLLPDLICSSLPHHTTLFSAHVALCASLWSLPWLFHSLESPFLKLLHISFLPLLQAFAQMPLSQQLEVKVKACSQSPNPLVILFLFSRAPLLICCTIYLYIIVLLHS